MDRADHHVEEQFTNPIWCYTDNITKDNEICWSRRQYKNYIVWQMMRMYRDHQQIDNGNVGCVVFQDTQEEPAKNEVNTATIYVNIFYL